jgi:hypothetical protein
MRTIHDIARDRSGASLVEFTLMAPALLALMVGLAEFGGALRQHHVMAKGVRDAARYLARVEPGGCPPAGATWGTAVGRAQALAVTGTFDASATPLLPGWTDLSSVTVNVTCVDNSGEIWRGDVSIPIVEVTASAPYQDIGALSFLGLAAPTITVSHTQMSVGA